MDTAAVDILESATLSKYTFRLRPVGILSLPGFRMAPFRGGFGKALLEAVCPERVCRQDACLHRFQCAYSYIFEMPVPKDAEVLRLNSNAAQPFIMEFSPNTKDVYGNNETLDLNLTLIGKAIDYLPYCVFAFERLGVMGIGKDREKYIIENVVSVEKEIETVIFSGKEKRFSGEGIRHSFLSIMNSRDGDRRKWQESQTVEIQFITPGRFEHSGKIITGKLEFHILLRSLLRRLSTLLYFHCGGLRLPVDFKQLIGDAKEIRIAESNLNWEEYERYSTRKEKRMKIGGLKGMIRYKGEMKAFIPFLLLSEYIHVGKSVSFGLGQVIIN